MHPSTPEKPSTTRPMRRADREVRSFEEIIDILRNCTEVRVAYQDAQGLTIVPVNFAFVYNNDDSSHNLRLLMHSATQGARSRRFTHPATHCRSHSRWTATR